MVASYTGPLCHKAVVLSLAMLNDPVSIPHTPDSIGTEWLTDVLRRTGLLHRAVVEAIKIIPIATGSGFVGQTARLQVTYNKPEPSAPLTLFAKLSSADPGVREQLRKVGIYETEAGFYRDLAPLARFPLRVPRPYFDLYDVRTSASLLLLEDLHQAEFGDNLAGCSATDAQLAVRQLGLLHAHFWDSPVLKELSWLRALTDEAETRVGIYRAMLPGFEQRCAEFVTPSLLRCAKQFGQVLPEYFQQSSTGPQTLTHGDFRADNLAFTGAREDRAVTVFDWQVARRSRGPRDLAYFLSGSLSIAQRRSLEESLIESYYKALVDNRLHGYAAQDLRQDVQAGLGAPLATLIVAGGMLDFSSERGTLLFKQLCARLGATLEDYQFPAYLDSLMPRNTTPSCRPSMEQHEVYSAGYDPLVLLGLSRRTAARDAAFLVPHLQPDMHVLDCGCGPGGISVTLASLVPQGRVVGIDIEDSQLDMGRQEAQRGGIGNVEFHHASVYALPFADATFDAVLAHAFLYHLAEPMKALRELWRVLKPGGLIGLRDSDAEGDVYHPVHEDLDRFWKLAGRIIDRNGGDARFGRKQRQLLREAGFRNTIGSASCDTFGTPSMTAGFSRYWAEVFLEQHRRLILTEQWATESDLATMRTALLDWGNNPDAFYARCRCEAVGWK